MVLPEKFVFGLVQVYELMDNNPDFEKLPVTLFMIAPLHQAGFDSFITDGPPWFIQKASSFLLTPLSRIMGYKSMYLETAK